MNIENNPHIERVDARHIPDTPMGFLWYVSKPYRLIMWLGLLVVTLASLLSNSYPYIFKQIVDVATAVNDGAREASDLWFWGIVLIISAAFALACWRLSGFLGMRWATGVNATGNDVLFNYISRHSHSYFSNRFAGSLSSKIYHAVDGSDRFVEIILWGSYTTALSLIITTVLMFMTNIWIGFLFLGLEIVLIPLNYYLSKMRRPMVVDNAEASTKLRGQTVDALTNMVAVRHFARRGFETESKIDYIYARRMTSIRQWQFSEWILVANNVIIVGAVAAIILLMVELFGRGVVTLGDFVMVVTLLATMLNTLTFIGQQMNTITRVYGEVEEGLKEILIDHEINDAPGALNLNVREGEIAFKDVDFTYGEGEKYANVFENLSFTIPAHQKVGVVGESGAGKTTLVSLLLRQHDVTDGAICIDGQSIAKVTQDSLRESIATVPQEPSMFHRTIRENIRYGRLDATDEEVEEAAKKAHAHDFILETPQGYETMVGERGVKLSGGQRQRIAIARAILKDAPILVLDEATSALDSESEVLIQEALHELMIGKTVIAIAHRLSTLREMDRILVFENGAIAQDGHHNELVEQNGIYKRLWGHQAGGFLQDE